jgi:phage N-6-adenine-methyltransferase
MKLTDEWHTPNWLFEQLDAIYGPFTFDVCASDANHKCKDYLTIHDNALDKVWAVGGKCWMNPPYSDPKPWVRKAVEESVHGVTTGALLPCDHSVRWYRDFIAHNPFASIVERFPFRIKFQPPPDWKGAVCGPRGAHMFVIFHPEIKRPGQTEMPSA